MTFLMMGYAFHRFVNESLRIEPVFPTGTYLTLSQWGSVVIFLAGAAMEIYLYARRPRVGSRRWLRCKPLDHKYQFHKQRSDQSWGLLSKPKASRSKRLSK